MSDRKSATRATVLTFPKRVQHHRPDGPDSPSNSGCRPALFILDVDAVVAAARRKRPLKNIAAQYGVTREAVWDVVTDALQGRAA